MTRFALRTGVRATGQAVGIATDVVRSVTGGGAAHEWPAPGAESAQRAPERERGEDQPPATPSAPPVIEVEDVIDLDAIDEPEPVHVSEEPELVEEIAEPGAEDGAGAEVRVAEPWEGYRKMKASEVIDRVSVATPAELAAVQLYENAGRRRETVLSAVRRELRAKSGSRAPAADQLREEQSNGQ